MLWTLDQKNAFQHISRPKNLIQLKVFTLFVFLPMALLHRILDKETDSIIDLLANHFDSLMNVSGDVDSVPFIIRRSKTICCPQCPNLLNLGLFNPELLLDF